MKAIGIVLLVVIAYIVWRFVIRGDALVLLDSGGGKRVCASLTEIVPGEAIVVGIDNNEKNNFVTVISIPRDLASRLEVSPPEGFVEELLPLTEKEKKDKKSVQYAEKYNSETLRWAGRLDLEPNEITELRIPAKGTAQVSAGRIDFQYEAKVGLGGSISFFSLRLDPPESVEPTEAVGGIEKQPQG